MYSSMYHQDTSEKNGKPKDEAVFIGRVNKSGEAPPKQVMLTGVPMHGTL